MNETASAPLKENAHVKELLTIMLDNGADASALTALLGYVDGVESQLRSAADELTLMRRELDGLRQERNHPIRIALQNASESLENKINETRSRLEDLKDRIVEGCKNAVEAFKEKGTTVLNSIANFFRIKPALENLRNKLQSDINHDHAVIAKVDAIGLKYHSAGMHLRNVGRALRGKDPLTAIKPNGKLAKLAAAPFRRELKNLTGAKRNVENAIASLERLEERVAAHKEASSDREEKPSVTGTMKKLEVSIAERKKDAPITDKTKHARAEL